MGWERRGYGARRRREDDGRGCMAAIVHAPKGHGDVGHRGLVSDGSHVDELEAGVGVVSQGGAI